MNGPLAMNRREFIVGAGAALPLTGICLDKCDKPNAKSYALSHGGRLRLPVAGLAAPLRVWIAGDTHLALHDARDDAYAANYKRMAQWGGEPAAFEKMLAEAKEKKVDLLCLVGDTISFPTLANVEYVTKALKASGLSFIYTAGNHDWHFEGLPGSDEQLRAEWSKKRLTPLYQGTNPLCASKVVKDVRFVTIDNSIYHVNEEQLAFWKAEAAKGDPVVLLTHVPLWTEGWGFFTCGCPIWGAAVDPYWEIERREKWAERQSPSTFAFREAVLRTPNLVAAFSGHIHETMAAQTREAQLLFSVPGNAQGKRFEVSLTA